MLPSATKQTKILSWFSVLESANNMKYAGDGKFIQVSCVKNYQHRTWLDRVIEKKTGAVFAPQGSQSPISKLSQSYRAPSHKDFVHYVEDTERVHVHLISFATEDYSP